MPKKESLEFLAEMFGLEGKAAIVTGASGGIGGAVSIGLARAGANVLLVGRRREKLADLKERIRGLSQESDYFVADVTDPGQVESMTKYAKEKFGSIHILVTCHGINKRIPTIDFKLKDWEEVVNTNLKGTFLVCQSVGKVMVAQRSGVIINVSSVSGSVGYEFGYAAYSPSKAGVDALTRTLAAEWGKYNIRVNAVAPHFIETDMTKQVLSQPAFRARVLDGIPLPRVGMPEDVVGAVIFLASKAASWITGQVIYIDGGKTIS